MLLTFLLIAYWIIIDCYFLNSILKLYTNSFTKQEVLLLMNIWFAKYDILTIINKRVNLNNKFSWLTRMSK